MTATATEPPSTCPDLLTYAETAQALHVSQRTAERMAADGQIDKVRVRGSVRIPRASVDAIIGGRDQAPRPRIQSRRI